MSDKSAHRNIIKHIHDNWHDGSPFAIWELRKASGFSNSSVIRVLRQLVKLRMVIHTSKGFQGRHYRLSVKWPASANDAIENFELSKILKI